jgi:hypothetical protein
MEMEPPKPSLNKVSDRLDPVWSLVLVFPGANMHRVDENKAAGIAGIPPH